MKILLTGSFQYSQTQIKTIKDMGFDVVFHQYEYETVDYCEMYDAVVCNGLFVHNQIEKFKNLKYIQLTSAGLDRVPLKYVKENSIKICNAAGVYSVPIAEHVVLKILELYKKSKSFYSKQTEHQWEKERNVFELSGKQAAIIGYGNIGREVAKRLKGFDVKIAGVDICEPSDDILDCYEPIQNLHSVLKTSDIVIITLPLTEETKWLIDKNCFKQMKNTGILVNVSRGQVIKQADLVSALKEGKIYGAALDVFDEEPLNPEDELWDMPNVIITPHNSFVGEHNSERMFDVIYKNLKEWVARENNGYIT